jgi:hypothetical protein
MFRIDIYVVIDVLYIKQLIKLSYFLILYLPIYNSTIVVFLIMNPKIILIHNLLIDYLLNLKIQENHY